MMKRDLSFVLKKRIHCKIIKVLANVSVNADILGYTSRVFVIHILVFKQ